MSFLDLAGSLPSPGAQVAEGPVGDPRWAQLVRPEERTLLADAIPSRVAEFIAGRGCARQALTQLARAGHLDQDRVDRPIMIGPRREPCWPNGVIGAITHDARRVAAAVAPLGTGDLTDWVGLGIDLAVTAVSDPAVLEVICTPAEQTAIRASTVADAGTVWFSAKESVFKAWFPATGRWLEHQEVEVAVADDGTWTARAEPLGLTGLIGRWSASEGVVRTLAVLRRSDLGPQS